MAKKITYRFTSTAFVRLLLMLLMLGGCLSGCVSYYKTMGGGTGPASEAYFQCMADNSGYEIIPDFGITHANHMSKCMREAGWERMSNAERAAVGGIPTGPEIYRRIGEK